MGDIKVSLSWLLQNIRYYVYNFLIGEEFTDKRMAGVAGG